MRNVIKVIVFVLVVLVFNGCNEKEESSNFKLPETIDNTIGQVSFITTRALVDSINHGVKLNLFFLQELPPPDSSWIVNLPGMEYVHISSMVTRAENIPRTEKIYLLCLYGDDSKKIAELVTKDGHDCYYIDGGSYRLSQDIQKFGWKILGRPKINR